MPLLLGGIVMWSGSIEDIPAGWALCDGTNETLDLRNRFVVGAGNLYSVGNTGGFTDAAIISHVHTITINQGGSHAHFVGPYGNTSGSGAQLGNDNNLSSAGVNAAGSHSHTVALNTTGVSATNANLPPYYALAFIQQIQ